MSDNADKTTPPDNIAAADNDITKAGTPDNTATQVADDNEKTRFARPNQPASAPASDLSGKTIKQRYLLESKIGSGGMSDIYRARDTFLAEAGVTENQVAIKVLQPQFVSQPEALQLLLQEAHRTQQLSHPNIVRVFDVDCSQDCYFIVMEYLDGESLDQVIKRYKPKGLPLTAAVKLLDQLGAALCFAHSKGIVHADLKPANIMVNRSGQLKVLDFGVAHTLQLNHDIYAAEQHNPAAAVSGYTPAYASTDLLGGKTPSVSDDTFSFGCISYELLTSKHPFERIPADKAAKQQKQPAKPAHLNLLQWLALKRALQFESSARNTTIDQLLRALNRRYWPAATAACIGVLAATGLWQLHNQQQQQLLAMQQLQQQQQQQQQHYLQLADSDAAEFLQAYGRLETAEPLVRSGLLRLQSDKLLAYFEQQIDSVISDRRHNYPDYPQIEQLLAQAQSLYPDSRYLADIASSMNRSKQTALDVLRNQLNSLLVNQQYQVNTEETDIYNILEDINRIDQRYTIVPDDAEIAAYQSAFADASREHDAPALKALIKAGKQFFANSGQLQDLLAHGEQLQAAVEAMAAYHAAKETDVPLPFPHQEAAVFYQQTFDRLSEELTSSRSARDTDTIYQQYQLYSSQLPADFSLLVGLKRQLADKYLTLSGELLKTNQVRSAERLMRRANTLMSSINS
ncbi:serine/threonine-protein kinase [Arsukibacterium indicum]|uniref:Serine/threonine protein kinase n=1 Tax=Arsukibacterium indicum TaxID=2848612 RepID=A0ABS6MLH5_9GAMM|nr:serine/threonine-protein kinase [Arsukibacterium indicum]MBV2129684.1 serine/threonine protein kinase [Arsukibacterium indicum]